MNKLIMLVGLPASGKSTIAKEMKSEDTIVVSSDKIRQELLGDVNDQTQNAKVFEEVEKRIINGLKLGLNVIYDATNLNYKRRRHFLQKINKLGVYKEAIVVATPYEELFYRNIFRSKKVSEEVIRNMHKNFYMPQYYEGWDNIQIRYKSDWEFNYDYLIDKPHDNPHHSRTILGHCKTVGDLLYDWTSDYKMYQAGILHDIGKLSTKTFTNCKGEKTDIAHYYGHEKASTYDALFYFTVKMQIPENMEGVLYILKLIQWHMIMHFDLTEKNITKYKNMLGEDFWKDLELFHKADCEGR